MRLIGKPSVQSRIDQRCRPANLGPRRFQPAHDRVSVRAGADDRAKLPRQVESG
jgi:hypothetical protein